MNECGSDPCRRLNCLPRLLSEHRRIIALRNILIHGYAEVDDRLVWDVVETKLPVLRREVEALLSGSGALS